MKAMLLSLALAACEAQAGSVYRSEHGTRYVLYGVDAIDMGTVAVVEDCMLSVDPRVADALRRSTVTVVPSAFDCWLGESACLGLARGFELTVAASDLRGVLAHEIAHAWQRAACSPYAPDFRHVESFVWLNAELCGGVGPSAYQ